MESYKQQYIYASLALLYLQMYLNRILRIKHLILLHNTDVWEHFGGN